jgi:hypothetical protein
MRRHGLIATPISTFGIGILSCFMVADSIRVRTHPGHVSDLRPALDLEISGPGSLFWTKPGTRERQGTEVTLYLRSELRGKPVRLRHDREECFRQLREFFGYPQDEAEQKKKAPATEQYLDPGLIAAQHVVWPKYPVHVAPPDGEPWSIHDRFHVDQLVPINEKLLAAKLKEWEYHEEAIQDPRWELIDWTDGTGDEATGTKVRLWRPIDNSAKKPLQSWELEAFAWAQQREEALPRLLVQSMGVESVVAISEFLPFAAGVGWRVWIDLRGKAAPRLTADRRKALIPSDKADWRESVFAVWKRFVDYLTTPSDSGVDQARRVLKNHWRSELVGPLFSVLPAAPEGELFRDSGDRLDSWCWATEAFLIALDTARARDLALDCARDLALTFAHALAHALDCVLVRGLDIGPAPAPTPARALAPARDLALTRAIPRARSLARARVRFHAHDSPIRALNLFQTHFLQEAFWPDLRHSWHAAGLQSLEGKIGDAVLTAPAKFRFELDGRRVLFSDQQGTCPLELAKYQYDLCFPMTAIPLGRLRREFPAWREDRRYRPLGVLPFLLLEIGKMLREEAHEWAKLFPVGEIYAFVPATELWYKPFSEWMEQDWRHTEHESLLWDIKQGEVLAAHGVHKKDEMRSVGIPFAEFAKRHEERAREKGTE